MTITNDSQERAFVTAQFPRRLRDQLVRSAQMHDRSISAELREAVRNHIEDQGAAASPEISERRGSQDPSVVRPAVAPGEEA
jgi:hypothetical protein